MQALLLLNKKSLAPLSVAKGAISSGFKRAVLRILSTEVRADIPLLSVELEEKGEGRKMEIISILLGALSTGEESIFNLERLFVEGQVGNDDGAKLAVLEKSLENEDPSN